MIEGRVSPGAAQCLGNLVWRLDVDLACVKSTTLRRSRQPAIHYTLGSHMTKEDGVEKCKQGLQVRSLDKKEE